MGYGGFDHTKVPSDVIGMTLHRIDSRERLLRCETVIFKSGRSAVCTTLNRAGVAGRVVVGGDIENHFADLVIDKSGTWVETVALDAKSYRALKYHWMPCRLEKTDEE